MDGYLAFLSYSHKDAVWGAKLHRRLEGYKLPKRLAGSETARGTVPERLSPVFRDREELSAGENLSDTIKNALAASDSLIVLCSPDARASPWVAKEIAMFRELHPGRPVLAALISGEPGEAFPEALILPGTGRGTSGAGGGAGAELNAAIDTATAQTADLPLHHSSNGPPPPLGEDYLEPIAADFRKSGDGERLALLKLVAGMTGVPLDALVQRDAQRQMRRVTAITGAALAAVLVMALLTTFAFRAQAEAERQRAEAEGLVEYMLTDLRDRLKGVGRLDVMTAVNERAMRYYGGESAQGLVLKARTLHAIGEDEVRRGNLDTALARFLQASTTTAEALRKGPDDPRAVIADGLSQYWIGFVARQRGDWDQALSRYSSYRSSAQRALALRPDSTDYLAETGYAANDLGVVYLLGKNDPDRALPLFLEAQRTAFALLRRKGVSVQRLDAGAIPLGWASDAYYRQRDFPQAERLSRSQRDIFRRMLALDPANVEFRFRMAIAERSLGTQIIAQRRFREGAAQLDIAGGHLSELVRNERANATYWQQLAFLLIDRAELAKRMRQRDAVARAVADARRLIDDAGNPLTQQQRRDLRRSIDRYAS